MQVTRLRYTPRAFTIHPIHKTLVIAEADHAAIPSAQRKDGADGMDNVGPSQVHPTHSSAGV